MNESKKSTRKRTGALLFLCLAFQFVQELVRIRSLRPHSYARSRRREQQSRRPVGIWFSKRDLKGRVRLNSGG